MDRRAWWATAHGVTIVGHDLATKLPPTLRIVPGTRCLLLFSYQSVAFIKLLLLPLSGLDMQWCAGLCRPLACNAQNNY